MNFSYMIGITAAGIGILATFVALAGAFLVEWVLLPRHRRRTGLELITPVSPLPGQAAVEAGLLIICPRLLKFSHQVSTIDKAPRVWRWVVVVSTLAGFAAFASMALALVFLPES